MLPVLAFIVRFYIGRTAISKNGCKSLVRCLQLIALCLGIFVMVLIDSIMLLSHMQGGRLRGSDMSVIAIIYAIYLLIMAFAIFPGRTLVVKKSYKETFEI